MSVEKKPQYDSTYKKSLPKYYMGKCSMYQSTRFIILFAWSRWSVMPRFKIQCVPLQHFILYKLYENHTFDPNNATLCNVSLLKQFLIWSTHTIRKLQIKNHTNIFGHKA